MSLAEGKQLGHYRILGPLGEGGMGKVFRAFDPQLQREVAVKVLQPRYANDPEWLARFQREARILASFSHPGIATVFGLDEADGRHYLVMELVPGETLAQRLRRGRLPLREALDICRQVAEALEAAHERGVIHRDLKPGNVMLTPEGKVKILDFGLARKAASAVVDLAETQDAGQTAEGVIAGTPAYMSPEQARGQKLDRSCDVWAFGCVLYEAITGSRPFPGDTFSDVVAALIEREPRWEALPPGLPPRVVELLRRCLTKKSERRLRDMREARLAIEEAIEELGKSPPAPKPAPRKRRWPVAALALAVFAAGLLAGLLTPAGRKATPLPAGATAWHWIGEELLDVSTTSFSPRVSPDGEWLAFGVLHEGQAQVGFMKLATGKMWVQTTDRANGIVNSLSWAPDSRRVYFDRFTDRPQGVYLTTPPGAGEPGETHVLSGADCPQALPDGSVFLCKPDGDRSRLVTLAENAAAAVPAFAHPVELSSGWPPAPVRALHKARAVVFCGKVFDGKTPSPQRLLYRLDLDTGAYRTLYGEPFVRDLVPLAVSLDDEYVYTAVPAGDLYRIIRLPLAAGAKGGAETVWTTTSPVFGMDLDAKGRLYLSSFARSREVLRFPVKGGRPERLAHLSRGDEIQPVQLPDGRLVVPSKALGSDRLLLATPDRDAVPLLPFDTGHSRPPTALVGPDLLAFVHGPHDEGEVKLTTFARGGRPVVEAVGLPARNLTALAASPDGKVLYFIRDKKVYRMARGGKPEELADGDSFAVAPDGKRLLVQRLSGQGVSVRWVPLDGGKASEVEIEKGELRLAPYPLGSQAIDEKGRALVAVTVPCKWFWQTALLHPGGKLERLDVEFEGDIAPANWGGEGTVLAIGYPLHSEMWRLTPRE